MINVITFICVIASLISYCDQFGQDHRRSNIKDPIICVVKSKTEKDSLKLIQTVSYINKINYKLTDKWVETISKQMVKTSNEFPDVDYSMMLAIFHTESFFRPDQKGTSDDVGLGQLTRWVDLEYNLIRSLDTIQYKRKNRHEFQDNIWLSFWYLDFIKHKYANKNDFQTIVYYNGGNKQRRLYVKGHKMVKTTSNYLKKIKHRMKLVKKTIKKVS